MNRIITLTAISLTLGACDDLLGTDDSGTFIGGPDGIAIDAGTVDCLDNASVELTMSTSGPVVSTEIYSQETGNTTPQWAENTNLESQGSGEWRRVLTTRRVPGNDLAPADITQDVNSLFRCDTEGGNGFHHNAGVMTYVFRAYDQDDVLGDCVIAGEDPNAIFAGTDEVITGRGAANNNEITAANCRVATFSY